MSATSSPVPRPSSPHSGDVELLERLAAARQDILSQVGRRIVGQRDVLDGILTAVFSGGHALLMGVPGLAKTLMVQTVASALDLDFSRIQFTPDLMPSDITGTEIIEEDPTTGKRAFRFVRGPVFANIVLADEINRTPPKTQAALLEAMQERQVTVGQTTHKLPEPFFVIATQNPIEQEGTYPLPEAALDRFMFFVKVDYPAVEEERQILTTATKDEQPELTKVLSGRAILNLQKLVRSVPVGDYVNDYVLRLVRATRPRDPSAPDFVKRMVDWGAGPRAGIFLIQGGKAMAAMDGRFSVAIDDIKKVAIPVLRHRISANFQAQAEGKTSEDIILRSSGGSEFQVPDASLELFAGNSRGERAPFEEDTPLPPPVEETASAPSEYATRRWKCITSRQPDLPGWKIQDQRRIVS